MAFTDDELVEVRSWVPWDADDVVLDAAHDRLGSKWAVIIERLRLRRQQWVDNPAQFGIGGGEYSQNVKANIEALDRSIADAEKERAAEIAVLLGGASHMRIYRPDPVRGIPTGARRVMGRFDVR
jgi:hypothetical protein